MVIYHGEITLLEADYGIVLFVYPGHGVGFVHCILLQTRHLEIAEGHVSVYTHQCDRATTEEVSGIFFCPVGVLGLGITYDCRVIYGNRYIMSAYGNFEIKPFPVFCQGTIEIAHGCEASTFTCTVDRSVAEHHFIA